MKTLNIHLKDAHSQHPEGRLLTVIDPFPEINR